MLNAAEGTWNNVDTGAGYYGDMDVVYHGVVAEDIPTFDLSQHFYSAARFIEETLRNPQSKTRLKQVECLLSGILQTLLGARIGLISRHLTFGGIQIEFLLDSGCNLDLEMRLNSI